MAYDLVVAGGVVVDGTGLARRRADVGVLDGRVVEVGHLSEPVGGARVVDADGLVVAPGIIDAHTHYDPQVTFEGYATSSCYHGVTTVLAGNCGFCIAPTREADRDFISRMFAKVEGMSPVALSGVSWDFETFPEYLASRRGKLGVNLACYVGHSTVRRWVMGPDASEREATAGEIEEMRRVVADAMGAGAAGFSSSHAPTQLDGDDRPIPSRLASLDELRTLVVEAGKHRGGSVSYLPKSSIGGLDEADKELLIELGIASRLPIIIQGLGGRNKVDAPTAGWDEAERFLDDASARGAAVFSLLRNHPFDRAFSLAGGTQLYDGVPSWAALMQLPVGEKLSRLRDTAVRDEMRNAVENPNKDAAKGSTLPPPHWNVLFVDEVSRPENEKFLKRSLQDVAGELGKTPADAMLDLALSEDLDTVFRWENKTPAWEEAVRESQKSPHMIIGVSDGGAHLDRDDGSDWSSYFLRFWVFDRRLWALEEGIRQMTQVPAALCGFNDRGLLLPGYAADLFLFDPETVGPGTKKLVNDFPGGEARYSARPVGVYATIVNGSPIVVDGELTGDLPGVTVAPNTVRA
ncbi:MAG: amidohydrolase [Actinobacteria bacterium]|nr:MAG: amidohydrolase [Actinomycetota bacterium]